MDQTFRVYNFNKYILQPGDATRYEFGFYLNEHAECFLAIDMPAGCGCGYIQPNLDPEYHEIGYLKSPGHGFEKVDTYTLVAILYAMVVLCQDRSNLSGACSNMLRAATFSYKS